MHHFVIDQALLVCVGTPIKYRDGNCIVLNKNADKSYELSINMIVQETL